MAMKLVTKAAPASTVPYIILIISLVMTSSTLGSSLESETQTEDYRGDYRGPSSTTTRAPTVDGRITTSSESRTTEAVPSISPRETSRLLLAQHYNPRSPMTCNRFPRICRATGSPGPDCCNRRCVDVMTDRHNCGWCGNRCGYGEACCRGTCVNIMYDWRNCGGCRKRCKRGSYCRYGMCSYA